MTSDELESVDTTWPTEDATRRRNGPTAQDRDRRPRLPFERPKESPPPVSSEGGRRAGGPEPRGVEG